MKAHRRCASRRLGVWQVRIFACTQRDRRVRILAAYCECHSAFVLSIRSDFISYNIETEYNVSEIRMDACSLENHSTTQHWPDQINTSEIWCKFQTIMILDADNCFSWRFAHYINRSCGIRSLGALKLHKEGMAGMSDLSGQELWLDTCPHVNG